jgi:hypothetical protein
MKLELPTEYVRYLKSGGILEGFTEGQPGYIALWQLNEVEKNNKELEVEKYAPGFLGFGGDGGGELLAFDNKGIVYMLPMVGMEPRYARKIAASWVELEKRIEKAT